MPPDGHELSKFGQIQVLRCVHAGVPGIVPLGIVPLGGVPLGRARVRACEWKADRMQATTSKQAAPPELETAEGFASFMAEALASRRRRSLNQGRRSLSLPARRESASIRRRQSRRPA
jgi:hypothetical protein